ncbi:hypothetical protein QJS66_10025 [Kocuria rhizophila]|nr:hypothetical protein QJS66_10025 [Kocuria rhizophila]
MCQGIEHRHGRTCEGALGPAYLELHVILRGGSCSTDPRLELPHPRAAQRAFSSCARGPDGPRCGAGRRAGGASRGRRPDREDPASPSTPCDRRSRALPEPAVPRGRGTRGRRHRLEHDPGGGRWPREPARAAGRRARRGGGSLCWLPGRPRAYRDPGGGRGGVLTPRSASRRPRVGRGHGGGGEAVAYDGALCADGTRGSGWTSSRCWACAQRRVPWQCVAQVVVAVGLTVLGWIVEKSGFLPMTRTRRRRPLTVDGRNRTPLER